MLCKIAQRSTGLQSHQPLVQPLQKSQCLSLCMGSWGGFILIVAQADTALAWQYLGASGRFLLFGVSAPRAAVLALATLWAICDTRDEKI